MFIKRINAASRTKVLNYLAHMLDMRYHTARSLSLDFPFGLVFLFFLTFFSLPYLPLKLYNVLEFLESPEC